MAGDQPLRGKTHGADIGVHGKHLNQLHDTWFRVSGVKLVGGSSWAMARWDGPCRRRFVHLTRCRTARLENGRTLKRLRSLDEQMFGTLSQQKSRVRLHR